MCRVSRYLTNNYFHEIEALSTPHPRMLTPSYKRMKQQLYVHTNQLRVVSIRENEIIKFKGQTMLCVR